MATILRPLAECSVPHAECQMRTCGLHPSPPSQGQGGRWHRRPNRLPVARPLRWHMAPSGMSPRDTWVVCRHQGDGGAPCDPWVAGMSAIPLRSLWPGGATCQWRGTAWPTPTIQGAQSPTLHVTASLPQTGHAPSLPQYGTAAGTPHSPVQAPTNPCSVTFGRSVW